MCTFAVVLIGTLALFALSARLQVQDPHGMGGSLITVAGVIMTLAGTLAVPWIKLSPGSYLIRLLPALVGDLGLSSLSFLLDLLGGNGLAWFVGHIESLAGIPGWLLMVALPSLRPAAWFCRLAILLGLWTGVLSLVWLGFSLLLRAGQVAQRIAGIGQAITALVASILLLLHVQTIDALGGADDLLIRFLTLVGGARMTMWVWVVWVGLLALAAGGFLAAAGPGRERPASNESEPKDAATLW